MVGRSLLALLWSLLLGALVADTARADNVRLSMSASSNRVQVGEPFAVEIRAEFTGGQSDDTEFDLPEFEHFEVIGRRVSRPFSFSFGFGGGQQARTQSQLIYSFTLRAPIAGRFTIQPAVLTVGSRKYATRPLTIDVRAGGGQPGAPDPLSGMQPGATPDPQDTTQSQAPGNSLDGARFDPEMFVRTAVDRRRAYVGEQVTVTIYLYVRGGLRETPMVSREPTNEGFWTQDLLPPQRTLSATRQEVNGRVFSVYVLRRYAAFPMRAGKLEIGPPSVETSGASSLFDLFNGPSQPVRRNGIPVTVEAVELPARKDTNIPVHVGQLGLEASLEPNSSKVGDAVTLRVVAKGQGNLRALKLNPPAIAGVEVLPPEIDDHVSTGQDQVGGDRVFRWLLLARKPGTHTVPPFVVEVLDPRTGSYATVQSRELALEVTGSADPSALPPLPQAVPERPDSPSGEARPTYAAARPKSALLRKTAPLHTAPWFPWAVLGGPLCFLLGLVGRWARARLLALRSAGQSKEQAFKAAVDQLGRAEQAAQAGDAQTVFAALTQALKGGLEARLEEPIGGLTRPALRNHLELRGMASGLADKLVSELERLDQARFAPTDHGTAELEQLIADARGSLKELERFSPKVTS